ncbi:MAG TPA: four helix bundle protein [Balneolaceae bacterium]|nr:four helix bundle protein [Balneolaceae bacterium]
MKKNIVREKSYAFALKIIRLSKELNEAKEFVFAKQLLKSGTSIGANVEEAIGGQSTKDFRAKLFVAYKEARETHYWLRLLKDSEIISPESVEQLIYDIYELKRILGAILVTLNK